MNTNTFTSLLQLLFIGLKLTGHLTWSWFWVLSPIWISFSIALLAASYLFVYYMWIETPEAKTRRLISEYLKK